MRATAAPRRRVWPWIAIVLAGLLITGFAIVANLDRSETPSTPPPSASGTPTGAPDVAPTGCLGGHALDAQMLLDAVDAAPPTTNGAIDVAASFVRWIQRYPYPSAEEGELVQDEVLASPSFTDDLGSYLAGKPDLSGGIVPMETNYFMSTVPGVWSLSTATSDQVVVSIGSGYVIDGELSPSLRSSITVELQRVDARWLVAGAEGTLTPAELYDIGTPFTGGC